MTNETNGFSGWLIRIFEDLGKALTFEEALHVILERMQENVPYQTVAAVMVEGNTNELHIRNARQISYSFVKKFQRPAEGTVLPRVLLKHETIVLNDMKPTDPDYAAVRMENDFRSACLTPIMHHQRAVGYLYCDRAESPAFSAEEIRRLQATGYLVGLLLEKFELLALTRHLERIDDPSEALKYHAFVEEYYRELARAKAYSRPLSLMFVDIDDYAHFMATCGINAGHALLNKVRQLIARNVRSMDVIGRFSADQFIVCLGGMGSAQAAATLEKIRQSVEESAGKDAGCKVTITGVTMTFERQEDFETPLAKVLSMLGSGLITAHTRGSNLVISVDPPRK